MPGRRREGAEVYNVKKGNWRAGREMKIERELDMWGRMTEMRQF